MVLIGRAGIYDARKKCFYHGEWMNSMQGKKVCVLKDAFLPSSLHCFDSAMKFLGSANAKKAGKSITIHSQNICHLLTKRSCN
jgi:hypothetical protein